jgi:hypothetical protein
MSQAYRKGEVKQPEYSENELLYKSFANFNCNKCYGTGRKKILIVGTERIFIPCKCIPISLWTHPSY